MLFGPTGYSAWLEETGFSEAVLSVLASSGCMTESLHSDPVARRPGYVHSCLEWWRRGSRKRPEGPSRLGRSQGLPLAGRMSRHRLQARAALSGMCFFPGQSGLCSLGSVQRRGGPGPRAVPTVRLVPADLRPAAVREPRRLNRAALSLACCSPFVPLFF